MEDKRTAIAVLLCICVIMTYQRVFLNPRHMQQAQQVQQQAQQSTQTQPVQNNQSGQTTTSSPSQAPQQSGASNAANTSADLHPNLKQLSESTTTVVNTADVEIKINHLGARITGYRLRHYKQHLDSEELLDMVHQTENSGAPLGLYLEKTSDDFVNYTLQNATAGVAREGNSFVVAPGQELQLQFSGALPDGTGIKKSIKFNAQHPYFFEVAVELSRQTQDGSPVWLEWNSYAAKDDVESRYNAKQFTMLGEDNKLSHVLPADVPATPTDRGSNSWVAFDDKYFVAALVPATKGVINTRIGKSDSSYHARASGTDRGGSFSVFVGPKNFSLLRSIGLQLERCVDLGTFAFIAHPLLWVIKFLYQILGNYGLAIILLTLIVKLTFLPLTRASLKSMKAMQDLQPEMKALRERIEDPTKLNQEMMALYKRRGVNPMGGCLPMLIQLPVFLGLYNALLNTIELRHSPFALWIRDLSAPERLELGGVGIPVMILLMGASMFVQQWTTPSAADPAQKKAMMLMPFIFTIMFIIFPFPAGLVLYWLVNNLISITQQIYLRREGGSPLQATIVTSLAIFSFGYLLTLL